MSNQQRTPLQYDLDSITGSEFGKHTRYVKYPKRHSSHNQDNETESNQNYEITVPVNNLLFFIWR